MRVPKYRHHKGSGQAVVVLGGEWHYLGVYGSEESKNRYDRLLAEWIANGRKRRVDPHPSLTVSSVLAAYYGHVEEIVSKSHAWRIRKALGVARRLFGETEAREFRGRALKACRVELASRGHNRRHVNQLVDCLKRCWRWALSEELVPAESAQSVLAVTGLRQGEIDLPEPGKILPVEIDLVESTLPHLPAIVADMVRVQLYSGARPGETVTLRHDEIDRTRPDLWVRRPATHKTAHHGHQRQIFLGPKAIEVLERQSSDGSWVFPSPQEPGEHYTRHAYTRAIARACELHQLAHWHPHQLRHTAATAIAREYGWEVARIFLGHRSIDTTRIYAEDAVDRVAEAVRAFG